MALQQPNSPAAETRTFIGPFLRFGGGAGPGDPSWRGSVLVLTRAAPADEGSPAGGGNEFSPTGGVGSPTGSLSTPVADARPPVGDATQRNGVGARPSDAPTPSLTLDDSGGGGGGGGQQLEPRALETCLGWTFWRFDLHLQLREWQRPVHYSVRSGGASTPTYTFWLPVAGQPMHWGYYSCNGLSADVAPTAPERIDPTYLWRDLLQLHSAFPLHCLVGGGDQCYNDGVWRCPSLRGWGAMANTSEKAAAEWTPEMQDEATRFYLTNYADAFSAPDIDLAMAQIPGVMMWDDHDLWDGYGSYDPTIQNCRVFQGLFTVARRFFLLFQQHTTDAFNAGAREFLGVNDGAEFHFLRWMGPQVAVLAIDMRSQRSKQRIMPQASYDLLRRTVAGLQEGATPLHLVVLSGVPVIFPKIPAAEAILGCMGKLTSSVPPVKRMARNTGLLDRFDQPEILDDLIDGWVAEVHAEERMQFIRMLQQWADSKHMRISILSGDAHVGGVGRFYSRPKIKNVAEDPRFMCQIISSAIVNAPPPHPVVKMLMRINFAANVDSETREKLVRAFYPRHPRTDKLIAQRNWCDISLIAPPFAPPTVPQDPNFGGLRFVLRVENAKHRQGFAEETYTILVPRHPAARMRASIGGTSVPEGVPAPLGAAVELQQRGGGGAAAAEPHGNVVAPEVAWAGDGQAHAAGKAAGVSPSAAPPHGAPFQPATPVMLV